MDVEALRSPTLDIVMQGVTWLGSEGLFVAALPLLYWAWRREDAVFVASAVLVSAALNGWLKHIFLVPRPFEVGEVSAVIEVAGYSYPSGHAQTAAAMWLALGWAITRSRRGVLVGALIATLIGFSRVYLGVHRVEDVVVGFVLGAAVVPAVWRGRQLGAVGHGAVLGYGWLVLIALTTRDGVMPREATVGIAALIALAITDRIAWDADAPWPRDRKELVLTVFVGYAGVAAIQLGGKLLLLMTPLGEPWSDFVRFSALGVWVAAAPWYLLSKVRVEPGLRSAESPLPPAQPPARGGLASKRAGGEWTKDA